jgi:esterase/lipase
MKDASLPWKTALAIADKLESDDVRVILLKNSTHRLNEDEDIVELQRSLDDFISQ